MKHKGAKVKTLLITISLFLLSSCSDKFPASDLYRINHVQKICEVYKINPDTVRIKFDHELPFDNCPQNVFGFDEEDSGKIAAWIRRQKKKYGK